SESRVPRIPANPAAEPNPASDVAQRKLRVTSEEALSKLRRSSDAAEGDLARDLPEADRLVELARDRVRGVAAARDECRRRAHVAQLLQRVQPHRSAETAPAMVGIRPDRLEL